MFATSKFAKIFENKYNATLIRKFNIFKSDFERRNSETKISFKKCRIMYSN